jgi:uracil-DNA glycosylase family protein
MHKEPGAGGDSPDDQAARALARLRRAAATCRECPLGERATQTVWGEGRPHARWMFVGEQPGDREDREGHPFVGPAGRLLAQALEELDWPREDIYVTNAVKHFKFEWRGKIRKHKTPAQLEIIACHHWLESEIATVRPEVAVALGGTAARALLGRAVKVLSERGHWLRREDGLPVLVTLHPAALLRGDPAQREAAVRAWVADLRKAQRGPGRSASAT